MIKPLRIGYCPKVLPLVYDDSLSYYEQLCKVVKKTNEVIEEMDKLDKKVDSINAMDFILYTFTVSDSTRRVECSIKVPANSVFTADMSVSDFIEAWDDFFGSTLKYPISAHGALKVDGNWVNTQWSTLSVVGANNLWLHYWNFEGDAEATTSVYWGDVDNFTGTLIKFSEGDE